MSSRWHFSQLQSAAQRVVPLQLQGVQSQPPPQVSQAQAPANSPQMQRPARNRLLLVLPFMNHLRLRVAPR